LADELAARLRDGERPKLLTPRNVKARDLALSQGWEALRLGRPLFLTESMRENLSPKWPAEMRYYGAVILSAQTIQEIRRSSTLSRDGGPPFECSVCSVPF